MTEYVTNNEQTVRTIDIVQAGEVKKYIMHIDREDFDMTTGKFKVKLEWGLLGEELEIDKDDMLEMSDGFVFSFDTTGMVGRVTATATWYYDDTDVSGSKRAETDSQVLCVVAEEPNPEFLCMPDMTESNHEVSYTATEQSDIAARYYRLVDVYDRPIMTADDEFLFVLRN